MTKTEFLQQLYNLLGVLPADERDDIIADFEEHFSVGTSEGKSEEQICSELGDPKSCAAQYLKDEPKSSDASYGAGQNGNPRYETKVSDVIGASQSTRNARDGGYYGTEKGNPQRNHVLWSILFFVGVFAAIGVYPSSIGLMASFFAFIFLAGLTGAMANSPAALGFILSIGLMLFAAGLFLFLFMTWFLKLSWRKADL